MNRLKSAYGAGWRAGIANGVKSRCRLPRRAWLRRRMWHEGQYIGATRRLTLWLNKTKRGF